MSENKEVKKRNKTIKLKAKLESKIVQELKKEYEEKIKKVKEKENAKIEKLHKEFSISILEFCLNDENFKKDFSNLIEKDIKIKKAYENLMDIYI